LVWLDRVVRSLGDRVIIGIGLSGMLIGKLPGIGCARYEYRQLLNAQPYGVRPVSGHE
jgi:hypothetical protein